MTATKTATKPAQKPVSKKKLPADLGPRMPGAPMFDVPAKAATPKPDAHAAAMPVADGFSVQALATELKLTAVDLRKALRGINAKKPGTRWVWAKRSDIDSIVPKLREWLGLDAKTKAEKATTKLLKKSAAK